MRLPATTFPVADGPAICTPATELWPMTFPSPAAVPPIVFDGAPLICTP